MSLVIMQLSVMSYMSWLSYMSIAGKELSICMCHCMLTRVAQMIMVTSRYLVIL